MGNCLVNGGASNHVENNLLVHGHIGIYCTSAYADKSRRMAADYDSGKLRRGDKMDYVWRCEQVVGEAGWDHPPWSERIARTVTPVKLKAGKIAGA